jgi:monofunctional biosynthetic peptidoglycan transglycosylase
MAKRFNIRNLTFKKVIVLGIKFVFYAHLVLFVIVGLMCLYMTRYNPPISALQLHRANFNVFNVEKATPVKLEDVSEDLIIDLIYTEDLLFYEHNGFDIEAIKRARELNKNLGYHAYGGSTLSQQVARTLFLLPFKTYFRKYLELLVTLEMEWILSKDRILELYLSHAEWGDGVYGLADACHYHYQSSLADISNEQGIILVTLLSNPIKYNTDTFRKKDSLRKRYARIKKRYNYPNLSIIKKNN